MRGREGGEERVREKIEREEERERTSFEGSERCDIRSERKTKRAATTKACKQQGNKTVEKGREKEDNSRF